VRLHDRFASPIAQAEAVEQADAMADDLDSEAVVLVTISRWCAHAVNIAHQVRVGQAAQQVDNAAFLFEAISGMIPLCNIVERDHHGLKRVTRPMPGFTFFDAAQYTLPGTALMHMLRKS
jgi:transposase-like protein